MLVFLNRPLYRPRSRSVRALKLVALMLLGVACAKESGNNSSTASSTASSDGSTDLTGAGATFPYPIYSKWFSDYAQQSGVRINYQSIGSGGGIRQLSEQTVDFGASDGPMSDEEMAKAKGGPVLHIPTVLGADVITYNLPSVVRPLNLSGDLIANIYLGRIVK